MSNDLVCWKCGASLAGTPMPLSRYERCRSCGADLYACKLCEAYEPRWTKGCREERAEEPRTRDSANFCDFFKPRPNAYQGSAAADSARAQLDALFGGKPAGAAPSPADKAREELEKLFGKKD